MATEIHVKGLAELQKYLDTLPAKVEKNVLRGSLRAGMKTVLPVAQQNLSASSKTGLLRAGLKLGTRTRGGTVTAFVKASGPHAYLAPWVEFGTKAHNIAAKKGGWLSFGGIFAKDVAHPGARPRKFLRPALDQQASAAVVAAAEYMKNRLATKHGIDTSDVVIDGDEA